MPPHLWHTNANIASLTLASASPMLLQMNQLLPKTCTKALVRATNSMFVGGQCSNKTPPLWTAVWGIRQRLSQIGAARSEDSKQGLSAWIYDLESLRAKASIPKPPESRTSVIGSGTDAPAIPITTFPCREHSEDRDGCSKERLFRRASTQEVESHHNNSDRRRRAVAGTSAFRNGCH